ncbi:hypothetical protein FOA52_003727 [Chlamydomonas sp. UWO 241]|nr:hypothetical protein FOA52_003727 [Chlamydomonas sp. UWO 241]
MGSSAVRAPSAGARMRMASIVSAAPEPGPAAATATPPAPAAAPNPLAAAAAAINAAAAAQPVTAAAATQPVTEAAAPPPPSPEEVAKRALRKAELLRGCKIILQELKGLDLGRLETVRYFQVSNLIPKGTPRNFDMARARAAIQAIVDSELDENFVPADVLAAASAKPDFARDAVALDDLEAMAATKQKLTDLWSWRRRGGGMVDEENTLPHLLALSELDRMEKDAIERANMDKVSSSLFDSIPLSDSEKGEFTQGLQQGVMASFQVAVWGSLGAGLLGLVWLNSTMGRN